MSQPDAAYAPDDSFTATSHKGLTYPFGGGEPAQGAVMTVAPGVRWVRLHIPGPLRHVNCWLLDDEAGVALVDTGMNTAEARDAWKMVFRGPLAGVAQGERLIDAPERLHVFAQGRRRPGRDAPRVEDEVLVADGAF